MTQAATLDYDDNGNQYLEVELSLMEARDLAKDWPKGTAKALVLRTQGRPRGQFYHPSAVLVSLASLPVRAKILLSGAPADWEQESVDQSLITECPKCHESLADTYTTTTRHLYERQCASCGYVVSHGVELSLESDWPAYQSNLHKWGARGSDVRHSAGDNSPP